ncbi:hypothetical protein GCM10023321_26120 [Pseudonocardia eucalypti]|uniref:Uncharacterized protein n=1 Tax=Pseudonocardia eucalypti TaxID=648755 RepID=A0ABP9PYY0_9PSEU
MKQRANLSTFVLLLVYIAPLLAGCGSAPFANTPPAAPDLRSLVTNLTSADPAVQETALPPGLRVMSRRPPGLLPTGSTLVMAPETWEIASLDQAGRPHLATIHATLTRPGEPAEALSLHLIHLDDQWLLYETSPS